MKARITKCFLIQITDDDGNEIDCEYFFSDTKKDAQDRAKEMMYERKDDLDE
ncbi:MAG: hypothetical protein HUJ53_05155 [Holdemanella sp.]|nr:hypothetical protein [Holdemanella sp.]